MKEATASIRKKLIELKDEIVKHYDDFKGSELEGPIGELMVHSFNYLKELPGEVAPATEEPQKEEPKSSIGSRLAADVKRIQEETAKGDKYYFGG